MTHFYHVNHSDTLHLPIWLHICQDLLISFKVTLVILLAQKEMTSLFILLYITHDKAFILATVLHLHWAHPLI